MLLLIMDVEEIFLTIEYQGDCSTEDSSGFFIDDSSDSLLVSFVVPKSPAAIAGLQPGDQLVLVNGHDVSKMPFYKIQSIISYSKCSPVTIKVLRQTENKQSSHHYHSKPVESDKSRCHYKDAVDDAFKIAMNAVGDLSDELGAKSNTRSSIDQKQGPLIPSFQPAVDTEEESSSAIAEFEPDRKSTLSPPPIPPYNPKSPDRFLLSNKPEYQIEVKKQWHCYEEVEIFKETKMDQHSEEEIHCTNTLSPKQGLPSSVHTWKKEHCLKWLEQLQPSFFDRYQSFFDHHDVIGHTLLHLNTSKLLKMGITDPEDRMQLGALLAKLQLNHECRDLEKLSNHVAWL